MDITSLLLIAAAVLLVIVGFKFLKGIFKVLMSVISILFIVLAILGFVAYHDVKTVNQLMEENKTFLYAEDGAYLAGMTLSSAGPVTVKQGLPTSVHALSGEALSSYALPEDKERLVIVVSKQFFANLSQINISGVLLSPAEFESYMHAPDPLLRFASEQAAAEGIPVDQRAQAAQVAAEQLGVSADEFRAMLFLAAFQQAVKDQPSTFIVQKIKTGALEVYPELLTVKVIRFLPEQFFAKTLGKAVAVTSVEAQ